MTHSNVDVALPHMTQARGDAPTHPLFDSKVCELSSAGPQADGHVQGFGRHAVHIVPDQPRQLLKYESNQQTTPIRWTAQAGSGGTHRGEEALKDHCSFGSSTTFTPTPAMDMSCGGVEEGDVLMPMAPVAGTVGRPPCRRCAVSRRATK